MAEFLPMKSKRRLAANGLFQRDVILSGVEGSLASLRLARATAGRVVRITPPGLAGPALPIPREERKDVGDPSAALRMTIGRGALTVARPGRGFPLPAATAIASVIAASFYTPLI